MPYTVQTPQRPRDSWLPSVGDVGDVLPAKLAAQPVDQCLDPEAVVVAAPEVHGEGRHALHGVIVARRAFTLLDPAWLKIVVLDCDTVPAAQVGGNQGIGLNDIRSLEAGFLKDLHDRVHDRALREHDPAQEYLRAAMIVPQSRLDLVDKQPETHVPRAHRLVGDLPCAEGG